MLPQLTKIRAAVERTRDLSDVVAGVPTRRGAEDCPPAAQHRSRQGGHYMARLLTPPLIHQYLACHQRIRLSRRHEWSVVRPTPYLSPQSHSHSSQTPTYLPSTTSALPTQPPPSSLSSASPTSDAYMQHAPPSPPPFCPRQFVRHCPPKL